MPINWGEGTIVEILRAGFDCVPADFIHMEGAVLSPGQLGELEAMVGGILEDNRARLEQSLEQQVDVQQASILMLYSLTAEEWRRKQTVVDNLGHFAMSVMGSLRVSWEEGEELRERLDEGERLVEGLKQQLREVEEENEACKARIQEAETHIESISGERDRMEEICRSQSCIELSGEASPFLSGKCSLCEGQSREEEQGELLRESSRLLSLKEEEVEGLASEKAEMERRYSQLVEEHELVKMEVRLAELAVKDALFHRSQSQSSCSHEDIVTTRSHHQFMNGELECFSAPNSPDTSLAQPQEEGEGRDRSPSLARPASSSLLADIVGEERPHCASSPCFINEDNYSSELLATPHEQESNPFKKRQENSRFFEQEAASQSHITPWEGRSQSALVLQPAKKTVALQCSLAKGLPKLSLLQKRQPKGNTSSKALPVPSHPHVSTRARPLSNSVILTPEPQQPAEPQNQAKAQGQSGSKQGSSITSLYSFLSSKIITNRIKK